MGLKCSYIFCMGWLDDLIWFMFCVIVMFGNFYGFYVKSGYVRVLYKSFFMWVDYS